MEVDARTVPNQLVVFNLDEWRYALHLPVVQRVVRMVEVTPLPRSPEIVLGVVDVEGELIPVMNVRGRFGLPERGTKLSDQLVVARTARRAVALVVDSVGGVIVRSASEITSAEKISPGTEYLQGVAKLEDGILLIHDLDRFLALDEEKQLSEALGQTELARND